MATIITTGWTNLHLLMTGKALAMKSTQKGRRIFVLLWVNSVARVTGRNGLCRVKCTMMMASHANCYLIIMKLIGYIPLFIRSVACLAPLLLERMGMGIMKKLN